MSSHPSLVRSSVLTLQSAPKRECWEISLVRLSLGIGSSVGAGCVTARSHSCGDVWKRKGTDILRNGPLVALKMCQYAVGKELSHRSEWAELGPVR